MAADGLPLLEGLHGQGGGAGHHEAELGARLGHRRLALGRRGVPRLHQPGVDGGDGHEQAEAAALDAVPDGVGVEGGEHLADGAGPEGAAEHVDDAVDVVEGQHVEDAVVSGPAPGFHEAGHLRLNGGVQGHDALGPVGGAAGVDDHGAALGVDVRQRGCGARRQDVRRQEEAQATLLGEGTQYLLEGRVGDDDGRAGVLDHVGELRLGVRRGEGHGHAAGAPDAPLGRDVVVAGRRQEGDAGLGEVRLAIEQAGGHGGGVGEELRVRERALAGDDGRAVSEALGTGYERYGRHTRPPKPLDPRESGVQQGLPCLLVSSCTTRPQNREPQRTFAPGGLSSGQSRCQRQ